MPFGIFRCISPAPSISILPVLITRGCVQDAGEADVLAKTMAILSFSEIARYRAEAPKLRTIAVTHDLIGRSGRIATILQHHLERTGHKQSIKVLDIGAYDRAFGRALGNLHLPCRYYSLDIDNSTAHEFHGVDEVNGNFDVISMFELIEHLPYEQVDELLHQVYRFLYAGRTVVHFYPESVSSHTIFFRLQP